MFAEERHAQILQLLQAEGSVRVNDLSARFGVTQDCIRKDLTALERRHLLQKAHGGAIRLRALAQEPAVSQRLGQNAQAKAAIARKAFARIRDNDLVFLDISTANLELAMCIAESDKRVTVVSNMVDILRVFAGRNGQSFICPGGMLNASGDGFTGSMTIECLQAFRFQLAFMGVVGADVFSDGVETYTMEDGLTKKAALAAARKAYLMMETRKFSAEGGWRYARLSDFAGVITETRPANEICKKLTDMKIEVL